MGTFRVLLPEVRRSESEWYVGSTVVDTVIGQALCWDIQLAL